MAQAEYVTSAIGALMIGANAKPSTTPVRVAHAEFVAALAGHPPRPIPIDGDAIDLEDRADHLDKVLSALSAYVTVILDDTAQNVPGRIDFRDIEAVLADLASDVTGTIQHAAEGMAEGRVRFKSVGRREFVGGSDARIIMGDDEALLQLWREKRGEAEPEDLSSNLIGWGSSTKAQSVFRFFGLAPLLSGSLSRICNMAVVSRRMDSARDGRSGCLRRHSSRRFKNSSDSRI